MTNSNLPLNQWVMQVVDREEANAQKGWHHLSQLTGAQRIALIEHLRMMWHGQAVINARVSRVFELIERAPR